MLAPNAKLRALVVPQGSEARPDRATRQVRGELCAPPAGATSLSRAAQARVEIDMEHCPNVDEHRTTSLSEVAASDSLRSHIAERGNAWEEPFDRLVKLNAAIRPPACDGIDSRASTVFSLGALTNKSSAMISLHSAMLPSRLHQRNLLPSKTH